MKSLVVVGSLLSILLVTACKKDPEIPERPRTVYFGTQAGTLYAMDGHSGQTKWQKQLGSTGLTSPTLNNDDLFIGSGDGTVYSINVKTQQQNWSFRAPATSVFTGVSVPYATRENFASVFVGADNGKLYALEMDTGRKLWEFATNGRIEGSPTVWNYTVVIGNNDGRIYGIDALSGAKKWDFWATNQAFYSGPSVVDGIIYAVSIGGNLYAIDVLNGRQKWMLFVGYSDVQGNLTVANGNVYVPCGEKLCAIDTQTGRLMWAYNTASSRRISSPVVREGIVYFNGRQSEGSSVYYNFALDALTGEAKWRTSWEAIFDADNGPVVADGHVYQSLDGNQGILIQDMRTGEQNGDGLRVPTSPLSSAPCVYIDGRGAEYGGVSGLEN